MSANSILVSWKPPEQPNGVVTQYTIYVRENSESAKEVIKQTQYSIYLYVLNQVNELRSLSFTFEERTQESESIPICDEL